jgi:hypothetical protein
LVVAVWGDAGGLRAISARGLGRVGLASASSPMYRIFISHAWLDRYYVKRFVDEILHLGCGVEPGEVFMSSAGDKGIPDGENLNTFVLKRIAADNTLVIAMLTPAYFTRPFCTAELGAAWSRAGSLFPLALPGMNPKSFKGVLDGQIVSHVDEGEALDRLSGRVGEVVGAPVPPERWNPHRKAWLDELDARRHPGRTRQQRRLLCRAGTHGGVLGRPRRAGVPSALERRGLGWAVAHRGR